ncbi:MAG: endonuclease/exonuclease/phosphatase family protein [Thermoleophilia bacterium]|nr:endonuclease/exonuclease/phosphatase family protein [Thermoleophilia bacterium]
MRIESPVPSTRAAAPANKLTVAEFNVENFFPAGDTGSGDGAAPTPAEYATKLAKVAHAITDELHSPDIVSLEEVGNPQALKDLMSITGLGAAGYAWAELPTNDQRHIDVAFLYRTDRVHLDALRQLTPAMPAGVPQPRGQLDPTRLFARPPLVADFSLTGGSQAAAGAQQIEFVANHLMSKRGGAETELFRSAQAKYLAGYVDAQRAAQPNKSMVVLGDLNTGYGEQPYETLATAADGSARLYDTPTLGLPVADRYTYVFRGQHDMLDHVLVTPDLKDSVTSVVIPHFDTDDWNPTTHAPGHRADASTAAGVSDHDPILTTLSLPNHAW